MSKTNHITEYGDFQTPSILASKMIQVLSENNLNPSVIVEPTCGIGEILFSSIEFFRPNYAMGIEINNEYASLARNKIDGHKNISIHTADIFSFFNNIGKQIKPKDEILFIGNPPWVTNSTLGSINSTNLPTKSNIKKLNGIEAITGKSNFDIAEYILMYLIEKYSSNSSFFAFLCKTIVARNLLKWIWQKNIKYTESKIYPIDSMKYFSAAVDACFFTIDFRVKTNKQDCLVYDSIETKNKVSTYGFYEGIIIKDLDKFQSHNYFGKSDYIWRNGIKHDCSKIMEIDIANNNLLNGLGETLNIEHDLLYPLLKSSDLQKEKICIRKYVLVTQRFIGEDTIYIKQKYLKTWSYLEKNRSFLESRKSSIYKNKPQFSIFSIGDYSFSPYKIAISGLYKNIRFVKLGCIDKKPILVDDTCNFIPCYSDDEANLLLELLNSLEAKDFFNSVIFWDSKRPVTTELLNRLSLSKLAVTLKKESEYNKYLMKNKNTDKINACQLSMF